MKSTKNKKQAELLAIFSAMLIFVATLFVTSVAIAQSEEGSTGYFIDGYDLVSYFRESGPLQGSSKYTTEYDGKTLFFASSQNLLDFKANPSRFMPAYNGYCAYGMVFGMKSKVDPLQYDLIEGKLYLQLDRGTKKRFNRRLGRNLKKSKRAWEKLVDIGEI